MSVEGLIYLFRGAKLRKILIPFSIFYLFLFYSAIVNIDKITPISIIETINNHFFSAYQKTFTFAPSKQIAHKGMIVFVFFGVVILFSLLLNIIDKVRSYNNEEDRSIWQDGDSVVIKPKDSAGITGGFGKKLVS